MYVCLCRAVSDRTVRGVIRLGAQCPAEVRRQTGAGSCCGSCVAQIVEIVREERAFKDNDLSDDAVAAK